MILEWLAKVLTPLIKNERLAEYKMLVEELRLSRTEYKQKSDEQQLRIEHLEKHTAKQDEIVREVLEMEKQCLQGQVDLQQYVHDLREYIIFKGGDFREFRK